RAMSLNNQTFSWETPPEVWRGVKSGSSAGPGSVIALYIARQPSGPMKFVSEVRAFADRGLEGDRFFRESWMAANRPDKAASLIDGVIRVGDPIVLRGERQIGDLQPA